MLIRWTELSYPDLGAYRDQAAVMINFASTEQHSLHLPARYYPVFIGGIRIIIQPEAVKGR